MNTTTKLTARRSVLAAGVGALLGPSLIGRVFAAELWRWEHFGVAPFASSREEAMAKAEAALKVLQFPAEVIPLLLEKVKSPGEPVVLANGDKFAAQIGKGGIVHGLEEGGGIVAFAKPVRGIRYVADAEKWSVVWKDKIHTLVMPEVCFNFTREGERSVPKMAAQPSVTASAPPQYQPAGPLLACPVVYTLKINVWPHEAMNLPGVAAVHAEEENADGWFSVRNRVSRTFGAAFRAANRAGTLPRSTTPRTFRVSLIMTPEATGKSSAEATKELVLGDVTVTGVRELTFTAAQLVEWDAIRVIDVSGTMTSPPRYHRTGLHELRFFNHLPTDPKGGTGVNGEWLSNPVPDCIMNEHWIE